MSNAQKAQDFVTSFMKNLAEGVELTQSLQAVFAKILAEQVVVDADTNVVSFKPVFSTLLKVLTFIATPEDKRPEAGSSYTQEAIDTAAGIAATETGLTVGEEIPTEAPTEEPTDGPTDEPTEEPTDGPTDEPTEEPGVEETISLTAGAEVVRPATEEDVRDEEGNLVAVEGVHFATANDDIINGVVDSLSSRRTLDQKDLIDGGAGNDTLNATLNANFGGFNAGFGMNNVETVNLTNTGNFDRSFNARDIKGVETYNLISEGNGGIRLTDLAEPGIAVGVSGLAQQVGTNNPDLRIDFATAAVSGQNDSLQLNLSGVGRADDSACKDASNAREVVLKTNNIEDLTLNAVTGFNSIDLDKNGSKTITVEGAGNLVFKNLFSTVTSVDASAATGNVNGNLTGIGSNSLAELKGGAGDDTFSVNVAGLRATSVLDGGEGEDILKLVANSTTDRSFKLDMSGFQTLRVTDGAATGKLTLSGEDTVDLSHLQFGRAASTELVLADMQTESLDVTLLNGSAGKLTYDGFGEVNISTQGGQINAVDCDGDLINNVANRLSSSADVVIANAGLVTFNVEANSTFGGNLQTALAEIVTLNIASALGNAKDTGKVGNELTEFNGTLDATRAAQINVNAQGQLNGTLNIDAAESLVMAVTGGSTTINAKEAAQIDITQSGDATFTLTAGNSGLNKVEVLNIAATKEVVVNADLKMLSAGEYRGTGSVEFTQAVGIDAEQVNLNAQALLGDFNVVLADTLGFGTNNANGSATIIGSNIGGNYIVVGDKRDATVQGGISDDLIAIKANGEHTLTGGLGADIFALTAGGVSAVEATDGADGTVTVTAVAIDSAAAGVADAEVVTITINGVDIDVTLRDAVTDAADTAPSVDASDVASLIKSAIDSAVAATGAGELNENGELDGVSASVATADVTITLDATKEAAGSGVAFSFSNASYIDGTTTSFTWADYKANSVNIEAQGAAIKGKVTITDFSLTDGDKLGLGSTTGFSAVEADASGTALEKALAGTSWSDVEAAAFAVTGNNVFEFGGNTYVAVADGNAGFKAGQDLLIELTGLTTVDLSTGGSGLTDLGLS